MTIQPDNVFWKSERTARYLFWVSTIPSSWEGFWTTGVGVDGVFGYLKQDCQRFASIPTVGKINKPPGNTREIRDDW